MTRRATGRALVLQHLAAEGPGTIGDHLTATGMSRAWIQARLKEACEADNGPIERDDNAGIYRLKVLVS